MYAMILSMDNQEQPQYLSNDQNFLSKVKSFLSANKYIVIFITVFAFISFGSTTYLLIADKKESAPSLQQTPATLTVPTAAPLKQVEISPSNTPTPTPTIAFLDETATWSAFLSAKYDYSIKYPTDWAATISAQQDPKILEYVVFNPKSATQAGTLSITLSYGTRTYKEALALDSQKGEVVFVASVSATRKNLQDSQRNKSTSIIMPVDTNTIVINAKEAYTKILDLMLTALKL